MGAANATGAGQTATRAGSIRWAVVSGISTGVLALLTAALVALQFTDRHFSLSDALRNTWELLASITDTALFVVLYVSVPMLWAILTVRWWLARRSRRSRLYQLTVVTLGLAGVFGAWAWLASALRLVRWVFDFGSLPEAVISLGLSDVDQWDAAVVAGLLCLVGCVAVNVAVMLRASRQ